MIFSPKVRSTLYVVSAVLTPVIVYMADQGVLPSFWAGLWLVINTAILGMAKVNVEEN